MELEPFIVPVYGHSGLTHIRDGETMRTLCGMGEFKPPHWQTGGEPIGWICRYCKEQMVKRLARPE